MVCVKVPIPDQSNPVIHNGVKCPKPDQSKPVIHIMVCVKGRQDWTQIHGKVNNGHSSSNFNKHFNNTLKVLSLSI